MTLRFHPLATREYLATRRYYQQRGERLGEQFERSLSNALERIVEDPTSLTVLSPPFRYLRVRRFPHVIVFRIWNDDVVVYEVAHSSRRPGYWRRRRFNPLDD